MRVRLVAALAISLTAATLAGCSNSREAHPDEYNDPRFQGPKGSMLGRDDDSLLTLGVSKDRKDNTGGAGTGIGVNAYIWRGVLDTLSFMPLISEDPFGGVIITDWYTPSDASGERFKATAYVLSRELRADAIHISLFRQVLRGGVWVDAPASPGTAIELEDKVLTRARELRAANVQGG